VAPYRIPPDPGYIGGYNWTAMLAGVGLLLLFNVAATQWIAYQFRYQPALGTAWLRTGYFAVYSPISWCAWVWRYAGSPNPGVRNPVDHGILIIAGGCIVTLGMFFVLNMQRTKRLSRNAEDTSTAFANSAA
jgi:type IV secretion system protein VirD4